MNCLAMQVFVASVFSVQTKAIVPLRVAVVEIALERAALALDYSETFAADHDMVRSRVERMAVVRGT